MDRLSMLRRIKHLLNSLKNEFNNIKINDIILYQWVDKFWDELDQKWTFFYRSKQFLLRNAKKE